MSSAFVVPYTTRKAQRRFRVRYRLGGRESALRSGGSFETRREAEKRAEAIRGDLARLIVPDLRLEQSRGETLHALADRYLATRVDIHDRSAKTYRQAVAHLGRLGEQPPLEVRAADVQAWVAEMTAAGLSPKTIRVYLGAIRGVLDFAELPSNPARSPLLRLPQGSQEEVNPPPSEHLDVVLAAISPRYRLHVRVLEGTGLRVGELAALRWGDLDHRGGRLRVARGRTKGRTAGRRWVPLPPALLDAFGALRAPEDRDLQVPVLPGFSDQGLRLAMGRACKHAGILHYTPHDLRHRYISLLVMAGVPLPVVREVVGHSRASVTLDTYSHVLLDEPPELLAERRALVMGRRGEPSVNHRADLEALESAV